MEALPHEALQGAQTGAECNYWKHFNFDRMDFLGAYWMDEVDFDEFRVK